MPGHRIYDDTLYARIGTELRQRVVEYANAQGLNMNNATAALIEVGLRTVEAGARRKAAEDPNFE